MKIQQYALSWTPKQITIFIDPQNGLKPNEIVKAHKFSFSAVTHVKNAIAKGEHPTDPQIKKAKGQNDSSSKQKASPKKVKPEAKEPSAKPEKQAKRSLRRLPHRRIMRKQMTVAKTMGKRRNKQVKLHPLLLVQKSKLN